MRFVRSTIHSFHPTDTDGFTLLWRSVWWHGPLSHDVVALVNLAHHAHRVLLSLIVLSSTTRGHAVRLGGGLLVHHGGPFSTTKRVRKRKAAGNSAGTATDRVI